MPSDTVWFPPSRGAISAASSVAPPSGSWEERIQQTWTGAVTVDKNLDRTVFQQRECQRIRGGIDDWRIVDRLDVDRQRDGNGRNQVAAKRVVRCRTVIVLVR